MKIKRNMQAFLPALLAACFVATMAFAQSGHYFNWYSSGAPRAAEQGTHGEGMGDCPFGSVVNGVQQFEGGNSDWVDGIGVSCINLASHQETYHNWYFGGERSAEQGTHGVGMGKCPDGYVVNGIQQFEGGNSDWVDGVGVACVRLSDHKSYTFNWYTGGDRGAEQGTHGVGLGLCPPGEVVVGLQYFEGGNSDWVDGIGVHCMNIGF